MISSSSSSSSNGSSSSIVKTAVVVLVIAVVEVKVQFKFILEQATKTQRGSRCIALLFL